MRDSQVPVLGVVVAHEAKAVSADRDRCRSGGVVTGIAIMSSRARARGIRAMGQEELAVAVAETNEPEPVGANRHRGGSYPEARVRGRSAAATPDTRAVEGAEIVTLGEAYES